MKGTVRPRSKPLRWHRGAESTSRSLPTLLRASKPRILVALGWYSHQIVRGIARYSQEAGWALDNVFARTGYLSGTSHIDGAIVIVGVRREIDDLVSKLSVPVVDLASACPDWHLPRVLPDEHKIADLAAEHFITRNFRQFVAVRTGNSVGETVRTVEFRKALQRKGQNCAEIFPSGDDKDFDPQDRDRVVAWLSRALESVERPFALYAANDDTNSIALQACELIGLNVPEEAALLGVDNDELICDFAPTPLSSVESDLEGLGYGGAALLDQLRTSGKSPKTPVLVEPKGVVVRRSSDILAIPDLEVAKILRFVWDHYAEPITAEYVASQSAVSRSTLYRSFLKYTGRPIAEEILRVRLEKAKELLRSSDLTAKDIGRRVGFSNIVVFSRAFKRKEKVSIRSFREKILHTRTGAA